MLRTASWIGVLALAACSESDLAAWHGDTAGDISDTDVPSEGNDNDDDGAGSEQENDFLALRPTQTDAYVFIANPGRNTLTRVNVRTLEVRTTKVGVDPRVVLVTPDYHTAVCFNRGDDTVSVVDAETLEVQTIKVRDNLNNMVMSPTGEWVALWHDLSAERPDDPPPTGAHTTDEVSLVHLATRTHVPLVVGFAPSDIDFSADGSLAVMAADAWLAVVDLEVATPAPELVQVAEDLIDPPLAEEVAVTPSGGYAFVRQFGATDLVIVDLGTEEVTRVPVGSNPTDLDITPDGDKAIVVSRGSKELYVFDTAAPLLPPSVLPLPADLTLGSVLLDPQGHRALLYTTAALEARYAVWDLDTNDITVHPLVKPVASMEITPTGESVMVVHTLDDAIDTPSQYRGEWVMSFIDLHDFRDKKLILPAEPIGLANSTTGERGYLVTDGKPYLDVIDYRTLLHDEYVLRSNPVYVGVLPDLHPDDGDEPPAWVSQEHELGRISFLDPDDGSLETITGFELNSEIED